MARKLENGLLSIQDVFTSVVETDDGEKACSFFIPAYQRGYKWTVQEVRKLLQDIKDFTPGGGGTDSYCLQNITLKRDCKEIGRMNVVDGQQRLTTTLLLLSFLKYKAVLKDLENLNLEGKLVYGVRDVTERFIKQEILSGKIWQLEAECVPKVFLEYQKDLPERLHDAFLKRNKRWEEEGAHGRNHSDIFHVYCAAMTIAAFFAQVNVESDRFAEKFWKNVCFLVNEVKKVKEPEIFSKINGFRVPLDGVDLLRAVFITKVARRCVSGARDAFEKELLLAEEHVKLGLALDIMSAWWGKESHWKYFRLFDSVSDRDCVFDTSKYPLNYLYKLFVAAENRKEITLDVFERPNTLKDNGDICAFYRDLLQFNSILKDWYEDRFIYHYAGFLCAQCNVSFAIIVNELRRSKSRRLFKLTLKKWILEHLLQDDEGGEWSPVPFPEDEAEVVEQGEQSVEAIKRALRNKFDLWAKNITDNDYDWYGNPDLHIGRVLVLLDVISFTKEIPKDASESSDTTSTYHPISDHLDPEFFKIQKEDKEHIFPQTPIGGKDALKNLDALRGQIKNYWELVVSKLKSEGEENPKECWVEYWNACELKEQLTPGEIFPIDDIDEHWFKWLAQRKDEVFASVQKRINYFVKEKCRIDLNSIGNIVLLNQKTNRMYGNDFYPMKRNVILSAYRDNMSIRLHTRSVFAKEFPQDMEISNDGGLDAWTQNSIDNNRKYIKKQLEKFFDDIMAEVK